MRLALFSPLSPLQTAIADHVEGILPYLAEFAQIDLFIEDGYTPNNPIITQNFALYSYREFPKLARQYEMTIYHMGDEPSFHGYIYKTLRKFPGTVVLHDLVLHHCIIGLTWARGDAEGYLAEMRSAYGKEGEAAALAIMSGRNPHWMYKYPLTERVLDYSLSVIVHNQHARQEIMKLRPKLPVATIPQHFFLPEGVTANEDGAALRERLGLQGRFVIATFGLLMPDKQLEITLRAFARFRQNHPEAVYLLVGPVERGYDLAGTVRSMGLQEAVKMVGWQAPPSFVRHMFVADLALQLRYPHVGGTPFTPIRLLGLGVPTIVANIEPLAEIPEGCCAKVDVDAQEEEVLLATMEYLATHEEARKEMAERGRRYIQEEYHPRKIAQLYKDFLERVLSPTPVTLPTEQVTWEQRLIEDVAAVLAEWGIQSDDERLLLPIAETIARLGLGKSPAGGKR